MKHPALNRICVFVAGALLAASAGLTSLLAQAQGSAIIVLPLEPAAKSAHRALRVDRNTFSPRVYVAVPHRPARFLIGGAAEELEESYDDTDDEFDAADADNDGFISFREARRASPEWARNFNRIDTSGDGFLTREEIEAFFDRTRAIQDAKKN